MMGGFNRPLSAALSVPMRSRTRRAHSVEFIVLHCVLSDLCGSNISSLALPLSLAWNQTGHNIPSKEPHSSSIKN